MGPGLTRIFLWGKSSQNSPKPVLIFWSSKRVFCLYKKYLHKLLKVAGYHDLSDIYMSVMGFQKKLGWGVGGWGELSIQFFFGFLEFVRRIIL